MKLRKILKHINPVTAYCYIYEKIYGNNEGYEEIYQGSLLDISYDVADKYIDSNLDGEGIVLSPKPYVNKHGVEMAVIKIYLRNTKESEEKDNG